MSPLNVVTPGDNASEERIIVVIRAPFTIGTTKFSKQLSSIWASRSALVIGRTMFPLGNHGNALVHIATLDDKPSTAPTSD